MAKYVVLPVIVLSDEQLEAVETAQQIGIDYEGELEDCVHKDYYFFTNDVIVYQSRLDPQHPVVNYHNEMHVIALTMEEVLERLSSLD